MAQLISNLFNIVTWLPIIYICLLSKTNLTSNQLRKIIPAIIIFQLIIPLGYILFLYFKKEISDFDMTKRKERIKPLSVTTISIFVSLILIYFSGNKFIIFFFLMIFILIFVNTLITLFWKISFHMAANTIAAILLNFLFDWQLPYLYILIPLIFWSRLKLKKHTVAQLIGGFLVNGLIIFFLLKSFGYLGI